MEEIQLSSGTIRYRESGEGEPIVFVHGLLVNGTLWDKVVPRLDGFRCIVPDWPLGSHSPAMSADADLSPPGLARIVADFLTALELEGVTLVGNDTGGAISQLVATSHPERLGRLVLTPCDAYKDFLPPMFRYLQLTARIPGGVSMVANTMRIRPMRRTPIAFGWLTKYSQPEVIDGWVAPVLADHDVRRDVTKVLREISNRYTLEAAEKLAGFDKPTLIAWASEDRFFKVANAERLAATIPDSRLEMIDDSYSFVPQDQPQRLAELMSSFMRQTAVPQTA